MATPPLNPASSPDDSPRRAQRQRLTSTGWRVVGDAIDLLDAAPPGGFLSPGRDEDVLYTARFTLRPRLGSASPVQPALIALSSAIARHWEGAPPLLPDRRLTRPAERFHGLQWDVIGDREAWVGELLWRHPHPVLAGSPCTSHVVITEQTGNVSLAVRVTADVGLRSLRGLAAAGQARPGFLVEMNRALRLISDGADAEPRMLGDEDIDDFVRDVLLADAREHPVAVLAPLEDGGWVIPPAELAEELLGLAPLYAIARHPATFRLSDSLGDRRLSCYWGALRIYMPGFSCADSGLEHPLLVSDRLFDPVMRADLLGQLGHGAASRVRMPEGVAARRERIAEMKSSAADKSPRAERERKPPSVARTGATANPTHRQSPADAPAAPRASVADSAAPGTGHAGRAPEITALGGQIATLVDAIARLAASNAALVAEVERLRTTTAVRAAGTTGLERRIGAMERLLAAHLAPPAPDDAAHRTQDTTRSADAATAADIEEPLTLVDVLRETANTHADALLILASAERSAADSPYDDADRVAVILDAMAQVARRRQEGALATSLREAFRELGIDYRGGISRHSPHRLRQQHIALDDDGQRYECEEHIVLGTSYDPRHCLRIYFTSRAPAEPRFVIAHVGRHMDGISTS